MNLMMAPIEKTLVLKKIKGKDDQKRFLNNLGFVEGEEVVAISEFNGDLIVKIKGARVAIGRELASRIRVCIKDDCCCVENPQMDGMNRHSEKMGRRCKNRQHRKENQGHCMDKDSDNFVKIV